jgi:hypothetical protein
MMEPNQQMLQNYEFGLTVPKLQLGGRLQELFPQI